MGYDYSKINNYSIAIDGEVIIVRSSWELGRLEYYKKLLQKGHIKKILYEKVLFVFNTKENALTELEYKQKYRKPVLLVIYSNKKQPKSNRSQFYLPDIIIIKNNNTWFCEEIKGRMDSKSRAHINNMAKHFPEIPIYVYGKKDIDSLKHNH